MFKKFGMDLTSVVALGIGSIVGAGIFALLGQVIVMAGDRTYYSFLLAGTAALFSGYSYARLSRRYPQYGGLTNYFHLAFKSKFVSGGLTFVYLLTSAISISMMAKSFGIYATEFFDYIPPVERYVNMFALGLIAAMAVINMLGSAEVGWSEIFMVGFKLTVLLVLIIAAWFHFGPDLPATNIKPTSNLQFFGSIGITFFAYAGYGVITNAASDVADPQKTIPRAIYITLFLVMSLYCGLAFVVLNFIPGSELYGNPDTAVATAAKRLLGSGGQAVMYLTAVIAFISGISATFFSIFRITRSLAHQHILPAFYMHTFWRHGTFGNLLTTVLIMLATVFFDFTSIVNLSSAAFLVSYLGVFAAAWVLRRETQSNPLVIIIGSVFMLLIFGLFMANILLSPQ